MDQRLISEDGGDRDQTLISEDGAGGSKMVAGKGARPILKELLEEILLLGQITWPIIITGILLFSRTFVSMYFLGHLGHVELAGGSLAMSFANITCYSVLKGLSMGMEPICGQAFGARKWPVLARTFQRAFLLLLVAAMPIALLWINTEPILLLLHQDLEITRVAKNYITYCAPDLVAQALLHPLNIFLRTQGITIPLTFASAMACLLNLPINYLLFTYTGLGVRGVALASVCHTVTVNLGLICYLLLWYKPVVKPWDGLSLECLHGWGTLVRLALPSAVSVCLEWWWYEVMMLLCGLLPDPKFNVAAMGILIQTAGVMYVLPSSIATGLSTRVSNELGAAQPVRAKRATTIGLVLAFVCGFSQFLFSCAVRNVWGRMFTSRESILALTSSALPIIGLCEFGNCPQTVGCGVLRGIARPGLGAAVNLSSFYMVGLPVALAAGFWFKLGFNGLLLGLVTAQAMCAVLMLVAVSRIDWEVQAERAEMLTGAAGNGENDLESRLHS